MNKGPASHFDQFYKDAQLQTEEGCKKFFSTLAGCDGGNIDAKVWTIGLEWYGDIKLLEKWKYNYYNAEKIPEFIVPYRNEACFTDESSEEEKILLNNPFDNLLAHFADGLGGKETEINKVYIKNKLYGKNSNIFKLNLLPLPRKKFETSINEYSAIFGI